VYAAIIEQKKKDGAQVHLLGIFLSYYHLFLSTLLSFPPPLTRFIDNGQSRSRPIASRLRKGAVLFDACVTDQSLPVDTTFLSYMTIGEALSREHIREWTRQSTSGIPSVTTRFMLAVRIIEDRSEDVR